jgi:cytochrome c
MNIKVAYFLLLLFASAVVIIMYQFYSGSDIFKSEPDLIAQELYRSNCAKCHGSVGEGVAAFPDIRKITFSQDQIKNLINHGAGEMPAFPNIKDPDLSYLVKYVIEL